MPPTLSHTQMTHTPMSMQAVFCNWWVGIYATLYPAWELWELNSTGKRILWQTNVLKNIGYSAVLLLYYILQSFENYYNSIHFCSINGNKSFEIPPKPLPPVICREVKECNNSTVTAICPIKVSRTAPKELEHFPTIIFWNCYMLLGAYGTFKYQWAFLNYYLPCLRM